MVLYVQGNNVYKRSDDKKYRAYKCKAFKTVLTWDEEKQEVVAVYENYLGEVQTDYEDEIIFSVGEQTVSYQAFNGVATCPLSGEAGEYEVKTINSDVDNGSLVVILNG